MEALWIIGAVLYGGIGMGICLAALEDDSDFVGWRFCVAVGVVAWSWPLFVVAALVWRLLRKAG